mgnify:CR=1 FL=1
MPSFFRVFIFSSILFSPIFSAEENKPVRVYVDMVADLFHAGHVAFLEKAAACGDELIVGLMSDDDTESYKRRPIMTLEERTAVVSACRYVTEVIPAVSFTVTKELITEYNIDLVVHGDDFDEGLINLFYRVPIAMGIFQTVPYTEGISTSDLIRRIQERDAV